MNKLKRIDQNLVYNSLYQVLLIAVPILTTPFLARTLGPTSLGINGYISSIASLSGNIMLLGLNQYGVRKIAQSSKLKIADNFRDLWGVQIIVGVMLLSIYLVCTRLFLPYKIYFILQIPYLIGYGLDISWFYIGMHRVKRVVIRNTFIKLSSVILIFMFIRKPDDLWKYVLINSIGMLLANLIFLIDIKTLGIKFRRIHWAKFKSHFFKPLVILAIPLIASQLYTNLDSTIVGTISGARQLAYYDQSQKISRIILAALTSASTVIMPKMAQLEKSKSDATIVKIFSISLDITLYIGLIITLLLMVNTNEFIQIFFGTAFKSMRFNMYFVSLIIIFISYGSVFALQYTLAKGLYRIYTIPYLIGAVFSIIVNIIIVPHYGANGGTVVIVMTEFLVCFMRIILLRRELDIFRILKRHYKIILAFFLSLFICQIIHIAVNSVVILVILNSLIALVIFSILLFILKDPLTKRFLKIIHK